MDGITLRPGNAKRRIVPTDAARRACVVTSRDHVENGGVILDRLKSVCAPLRNVDHGPLLCGQRRPERAPERLRSPTQVHHGVEQPSGPATHELGFRMRLRLVMEAAHGSAPTLAGEAGLLDHGCQAAVCELLL